jgi:hypothetical protein
MAEDTKPTRRSVDAPAAPSAPSSSQADVVDRWFQDTFHNQPLSTELYNRFYAAKDTLKAQLAAVAT